MAVIELVLEPVVKKPASSKKSAARAETPKAKPVAEATPVEETATPAEDVVEESAEVDASEAAEDTTDAAPAEESEEK
jgi:large subunit ribosomal protein L17